MTVAEAALDNGAGVRLADERAIIALIYKAAACADEQRFVEWMELFTEDGVYGAITFENLKGGLHLFKDSGRRALQERAAYQIGIWQVPRAKILHLVSNIVVSAGDTKDQAKAASNFIMTRTDDSQHSRIQASGQYRDLFERRGDAWLFKSRQVIVDSNLLPGDFTELL